MGVVINRFKDYSSVLHVDNLEDLKWIKFNKDSNFEKVVACDIVAYNGINCDDSSAYVNSYASGNQEGELLTTNNDMWIGYYHMYKNRGSDDSWLLTSIVVLPEFQNQRFGTYINDRLIGKYGIHDNIIAWLHEDNQKQNVKYTECYGFEFTGTSEIKEDGRWNEFIRYAEEYPRHSTNTHKKTDR